MKSELDILIDVAKKLDSIKVQYMLTGSFAMNYYAEPRMTRDIDIVVELKNEDRDKILRVFKDDYYISKSSVNEAIKMNRMFNIIHNETILKIDFVIKKKSEYRNVEFKRKKIVKINGYSIKIVSIEDLIISKIIWAKDSMSDFQKRDILNLLNQNPDEIYLSTWIEKLNLNKFYNEFINE